MSRQEEIREGVILITKGRPMAYQLLKYLDTQGAVLKVERELPIPKWEEVEGAAMEVDSDTWVKMLAILAVILKRATKAGWAAVEPLV